MVQLQPDLLKTKSHSLKQSFSINELFIYKRECMYIDISDENKRKSVKDLLLSFDKKSDIYAHYGVCDNSQNVKYVNYILEELGIKQDYYHTKRYPNRFCVRCGKLLKKGQKKFCSHNCSCLYNSEIRTSPSDTAKKHISDGLKKHYEEKDGINVHGRLARNRYKNRVCKFCGSIKIDGKCEHSQICKYGNLNAEKNYKYFGFDLTSIGTLRALEEYNKVKELLLKEYNENLLSVSEIKEKYGYPGSVERLVYILKSFGIKLRNTSSSVRNAYLRGKLNIPDSFSFNSGWHTKNDGSKVFYRSSYELEYCRYLDEHDIEYNVEDLRIKYYDTEKQIERVAIPDFHLLNENTIVEVKSPFTFIKQNMIDKVLAYKQLGYNFKLLYNGIVYNEDEMLNIKELEYTIDDLKR